MNNVIMVRVKGLMNFESQRKYRELLLKDIKEGLFIVDDSVGDVIVTTIDKLGIEEEWKWKRNYLEKDVMEQKK